MGAEEEKRWQMIEQVLAAEQAGKRICTLSSRRTLFGIPSKLESELAAYAASRRVSRVAEVADVADSEVEAPYEEKP